MSRIRHGTRSAYVSWKCRCEPCKTADTMYHNKKKGRKGMRLTPHMLLKHEIKGVQESLEILEDDFGVGAPVTRKISSLLKSLETRLESEMTI